jgi:hypothetical protein
MSRELSEETRGVILSLVRKEPTVTATKLASLTLKFESMRSSELEALITKELDRAKKFIKAEYDEYLAKFDSKCQACEAKVGTTLVRPIFYKVGTKESILCQDCYRCIEFADFSVKRLKSVLKFMSTMGI